MAKEQINAETLERSEHLIKVLFEKGEWPKEANDFFHVDPDGLSKFLAHNVNRVRMLYPDIDPRHEAAIATMLSHVFYCGVAAGRQVGYSEDSGLNT